MNEGDAPAYLFVDIIDGKLTVVAECEYDQFRVGELVRTAQKHPNAILYRK